MTTYDRMRGGILGGGVGGWGGTSFLKLLTWWMLRLLRRVMFEIAHMVDASATSTLILKLHTCLMRSSVKLSKMCDWGWGDGM